MHPCWMFKSREICFVHLGKFGDIMIMLPAFKKVFEQTGTPPICMVSKDFSSIFEGVSYVRPWIVDYHWWRGVGNAKQDAIAAGYDPIVVKWWDEPGAKAPGPIESARKIRLKVHGRWMEVAAEEWDSFQASQWRYSGFSVEEMMKAPLEFDRRSPYREDLLRLQNFRTKGPKLLVNLSKSGTSPFTDSAQALALLKRPQWEIVNLATVKAPRIFDLLGFYDHACGLVTSDTSTLHLAAASSIPYIAFVNNGGAGSIPKGNCILSIRYGEFRQKMGEFLAAVQKIESGI